MTGSVAIIDFIARLLERCPVPVILDPFWPPRPAAVSRNPWPMPCSTAGATAVVTPNLPEAQPSPANSVADCGKPWCNAPAAPPDHGHPRRLSRSPTTCSLPRRPGNGSVATQLPWLRLRHPPSPACRARRVLANAVADGQAHVDVFCAAPSSPARTARPRPPLMTSRTKGLYAITDPALTPDDAAARRRGGPRGGIAAISRQDSQPDQRAARPASYGRCATSMPGLSLTMIPHWPPRAGRRGAHWASDADKPPAAAGAHRLSASPATAIWRWPGKPSPQAPIM